MAGLWRGDELCDVTESTVRGPGPLVVTARRLGVEEELLLTDRATGDLRPAAQHVLAELHAGAASGGLPAHTEVKHEFYLSQVEVATGPHTSLDALRDALTAARACVSRAGEQLGVAPLAVPGPLLEADPDAPNALSPSERYLSIAHQFGEVATQSLMCALHVHVEIADEHEGVAVVDRVRPWIPVLVAMSANSPFWRGRDMGYDSWRSRVFNMWPTAGPTELFGGVAAYRARVRDLISQGAALDEATVSFDVRLSHRYPTVEFRMADVCTEVQDAVVMAAIVRALVDHCAEEWQAGVPAREWRLDELRVAAWRAARFGLGDTLVCPSSRDLVDARVVVGELITMLGPALERAGDAELAAGGVAALETRGNGAARQRAVLAGTGSLADVVADVRARTLRC